MLDTNINSDFDQTQFGNESWLYGANKPSPGVVDPNTPPKPIWWQTKNGKIILVGGVIALLLLVGVIVLALNSNQAPEEDPSLEDDAVVEAMDLGPLGDKVKALRSQLKLVDPTKEQDPYPPVRQDLRLDPDSEL